MSIVPNLKPLTRPQLELALQYLSDQTPGSPPEELSHLEMSDWEQIYSLLKLLRQERQMFSLQ
jgi:hypothetical protein